MKKHLMITVLAGVAFAASLGVAVLSVAHASGAVYTNSYDFLRAEGASCQVATDGCNTITVNNGQLGASTMMYCANIYEGQEAWSCTKQIGQLSADDQSRYENAKMATGWREKTAVENFIAKFRSITYWSSAADTEIFKQAVLGRLATVQNFLWTRTFASDAQRNSVTSTLELAKYELMRLK